ncbi:uncharacterized protein LOC121408010 [Lytechinus variegatus]|uniref:uncharacterized protein LOC121408010 n=1 Tax=Lytechinus variegatus TaxID=7654 RepID=UPI001BB2C5E6|nr:uncharacterized protein LOC121408010 [Lytechinus variegatus]
MEPRGINAAHLRYPQITDAAKIKDVVPQEEERIWIDNLLAVSEEPDEGWDYIDQIICNDWNLAVRGWDDTVPYVKYAWGDAPVTSKKREAEDHGGGKRNRGRRHQQPPVDDSWKRCVEPRTYRYVYDPKGLHHTTLKYYSGVTLERSVEDDGFSDHILKLREYLEKTLNHAKKETSQGIKEHAKLGQYVANKTSTSRDRREKHSLEKKVGGKLRGLGEGLYVMTDDSCPEDEEDARVTLKGVEGKGLDDSLRSKIDRQPTPILPIRKVEKVNHGQIDHITNQRESPRLKLTHGLNVGSGATSSYEKFPTNSYEKFPTHSVHVTPHNILDLTLNPLKKVTPYQRQIHDDNEVLLHDRGERIPPSKPSSAKSEPDHTPSYKVLLERSSAPHMGSRGDRTMLAEVNGKAMPMPPPVKEFPLAQELAAVSKLLRDQDQKNKHKGKQGKSKPIKLGAGYVNEAGPKLGDPLHRGVMDRETAGAMAAELLPGVSGHKLNLPAYSQRIL